MKKIVFTLALLAGLGGAAEAQRSNVSLGVKAGGTLTEFVGADAASTYAFFGAAGGNGSNNRLGFQAGVFANIGLTKLVAFQPELLYSQKGAKSSNSNDIALRLHYIEIPLAFHVNTDGFFFEAGPQVSFLAGAKLEVGSLSTDLKDSYKTTDIGYLAGLGYQLKQGLGIGLRYNGEFTEFPKSSTVGTTVIQSRLRNSAFQLYATYSFNGR